MTKPPFLTLKESIYRADIDRAVIKPEDTCMYGIKPLDDALFGIIRSELVVIGADSGVGKTEICNHITYHNAKNGKKVCLISLEGERNEFINRMKYRHISENYFRNEMWKYDSSMDLSYKNYVTNRISGEGIIQLNEQANKFIEGELGENLYIFDREDVTDIDKVIEALGWKIKTDQAEEPSLKNPWGTKRYRSFFDLIVIDHLHYFDMDASMNMSENNHVTRIMREIKKYTEQYNVPVVLVSHLRKKFRDRGLPDIDDLHGSSNIPKISTTTIMISPCFDGYKYKERIFPTYMRVVKNRSPETKSSLCMLIDFDGNKMRYVDKYKVLKVNMNTGQPEELESDNWPKWAEYQKEENHDSSNKIY